MEAHQWYVLFRIWWQKSNSNILHFMFFSLSLSLSLSLLSSLPPFYSMFMFYDKTAYIIREMHVRTLALLCYFSDSSLASLCYAKVTSLVAEPMRWGANPPSLFLSLSLSLLAEGLVLCDIRIGAIWGDRLL